MAVISGILKLARTGVESTDVAGFDAKQDLVGEFQRAILVRQSKGFGNGANLFALCSHLKNESASNSEFNWFERDPVRRTLFANGANVTPPASAQLGGQTLTLSATADGGNAFLFLAAGHILMNSRTGEYVRVETDPTTNGITVTRAFNVDSGSPVPPTYTVADGDEYIILTLGKAEGSKATRSRFVEADPYVNFIQTFNAAIELTNAAKANELRSDPNGPIKEHRIQALESYGRDVELAYLFGVKRRVHSAAGLTYFTGGVTDAVNRFAPANKADFTVNNNIGDFKLWLQSFMLKGSDKKIAFCGPTAYAALSNFCNSQKNGFRYDSSDTVYGMNVTTIVTPFGQLDLTMHPLMHEIAPLRSWMVAVDLRHVIQKTMEKTVLLANQQDPDADGYKEQLRGKLGLKLQNAEGFGYCKGLSELVEDTATGS